jgi:signal transduction histidine kinase/CheY-like chemotaxis protein
VPLHYQTYHLNHLNLPATEALLTIWEGIIVDQAFEGWRESLTLRPAKSGDSTFPSFECVYLPNKPGVHLFQYEIGSRVNVRGVLELQYSPSHIQPVTAKMLVSGPQDISLIARPPWESRFPWTRVFGLLALLLTGAVAWLWTLRRRVRIQTADLNRALVLAEAASRAKSEFLANVSHEIRTPMNGFLGMTDMALATSLTSDQRGFLEVARGSARILLTIVNDILDVSKIQAGKLTIERIEFSLPHLISATLAPFGSLASEKGIELALDLHPGLPRLVLGDPARTGQIISNLVSNAMKFTESGEVIVSARSLDAPAGAEDGPHEIEVSVRDTGIGIPHARQHLLFQTFTQTDYSMSRRLGGTGLGLAISLRLAEAMGGRMWVDSKLGTGSTFFFTMRLDRSPSVAQAETPETRLAGMWALVVDDNPTSLGFMGRWLSSLGMEHCAARSGTEALEILKAGGGRFDFVIADHHMPGMTGSRFLQIAGHRGWLPSSGEDTSSLLLCSGPPPIGDCGASRILLKPLARWELVAALVLLSERADRTRSPSPALSETLPKRKRGACRILIAEDSADNRNLIRLYMKRGGYDAVLVEDGKEAVAAWESGAFSLILMDGQMPEMDGLQATSVIRERERGRRRPIPIIGLTAYANEGDRERFLGAGMTDYLTKPIAYADLMDAIERGLYSVAA